MLIAEEDLVNKVIDTFSPYEISGTIKIKISERIEINFVRFLHNKLLLDFYN